MIKIDKVDVFNFENAIRGARNPMNSWDKSDSEYRVSWYSCDTDGMFRKFFLGENDLKLASKLCKAGSDHRKFMRQIFVSMDILAPLYWWKEFDTYKVGTVANSCSTMHKLTSKRFELNDFSHDKMNENALMCMIPLVNELERLREEYLEEGSKDVWYSIIQLLPSSYNQLRTVTMTYENLINIYNARKNHKLSEWHVLCDVIKGLPYANELICFEK